MRRPCAITAPASNRNQQPTLILVVHSHEMPTLHWNLGLPDRLIFGNTSGKSSGRSWPKPVTNRSASGHALHHDFARAGFPPAGSASRRTPWCARFRCARSSADVGGCAEAHRDRSRIFDLQSRKQLTAGSPRLRGEPCVQLRSKSSWRVSALHGKTARCGRLRGPSRNKSGAVGDRTAGEGH